MIKCPWCRWFKCTKPSRFRSHIQDCHPDIYEEMPEEWKTRELKG